MRIADLLEEQITRQIRDAAVSVDYDHEGMLVVTVTAESFGGLRPVDRESRVYESLSRVPLVTLTRVGRIVCQVEAPDTDF